MFFNFVDAISDIIIESVMLKISRHSYFNVFEWVNKNKSSSSYEPFNNILG